MAATKGGAVVTGGGATGGCIAVRSLIGTSRVHVMAVTSMGRASVALNFANYIRTNASGISLRSNLCMVRGTRAGGCLTSPVRISNTTSR